MKPRLKQFAASFLIKSHFFL